MTTSGTFGIKLAVQGLAAYKTSIQQAIAAQTQLTSSIQTVAKQSTSSFAALSAVSTTALTGMVALAGAAASALIGVGAAASKVGAEYEKGLARAAAVTNATNNQMKQLDKTIKEVASYSDTAINDLNAAVTMLAQGGVAVDDISNGVLKYTDFLVRASQGELDMARASTIVAGSMSAFKLKGEEVFRVVNSITAAATASAITFGDVERSFRQAITITSMLGYTVEETAALVGTLGREFLRGSDAGTSFKAFVIQLSKFTKDGEEAARKYGISLSDASGKSLAARDVVKQLEQAFSDQAIAAGKITEAERRNAIAAIFGQDAMRAGIALAKQGVSEYDKLIEATQKISAAQMAQRMSQDVLLPQLGILKNNIKIFGIEMSMSALPAITGMVQGLNSLIRTLQKGQIPALMGAAFKSLLTGKDFPDVSKTAENILGPNANKVFQSWLLMIQAVRNAVVSDLVPAFQILLSSITGGGGPSGLANIFNLATTAIKSTSYWVSTLVVGIGKLISDLKANQQFMNIFQTMAQGFSAAPFIMLLAVLTPVLLTIGKIGLAAFALGKAIEYIGSNPEAAVQALHVVIKALGVTLAAVATVQMVTFVAGLNKIAVTAIGPVVTAISSLGLSIISFVASLAASTLAILYNMSVWIASQTTVTAVWLRNIALMSLALTGSLVKTLLYVSSVVVAQSAIWVAAHTRMLIASTKATAGIAAAWIGTALKGFLMATGGILAAVAPFIVGIAAIATASALIATAWQNNWLDIQGFTGRVLQWVGSKIGDFLNWLKSLPIIGGWVTAFGDFLGNTGEAIAKFTADTGKGLESLISQAKQGFPEYRKELDLTAQSYEGLDEKVRQLEQDQKDYYEAIAKAEEEARANIKQPERGDSDGGLWFPSGGGGADAEESIRDITNRIWALIGDLPAVTKDLAGYLAGIVKDFPERLAPMVGILRQSRDSLAQMVIAKYDLLVTTRAIEESEQRIADYESKIARLDLQSKIVTLGYERQLLDIRQQISSIDKQMWPLKDRLAAIDREMTALQRANLDIAKERAQIELAILPQRQRIAEIEKLIKDNGKENYQLAYKQIELQLAMLPIKNQLYEVERKISQIENKRLSITTRINELLSEQSISDLEFNLKGVERDLEKAWDSMDVKNILKLEEQAEALKKQIDPAKEQLDIIRKTQEDTERQNEIRKLGIEYQKVALEELLDPMQYQLDILKQQEELYKLTQDLIKTRYEIEKAAIEQSIKAQTDKLFALEQSEKAEKARHETTIIDLQIEKIAIEAQLVPLELQRQALERVQEQVRLNMQEATYAFEVQKLQYEQLKAEEELRRMDLEETRKKQRKVFDDLVLAFVDAMVQSGAFTLDEAIEVASRIRMWDDQVAKLVEVELEFKAIAKEAWNVKSAIDAIPKDVTITITTVHKDVYDNAGGEGRASGGPVRVGRLYTVGENGPEAFVAPSNGYIMSNSLLRRLQTATPNTFSNVYNKTYNTMLDTTSKSNAYDNMARASGGPVQMGSTYTVGEQGIEAFISSVRSSIAPLAQRQVTPANILPKTIVSNSYSTTVNNNYNVNANYGRIESPASIGMDLRAISAMTRR